MNLIKGRDIFLNARRKFTPTFSLYEIKLPYDPVRRIGLSVGRSVGQSVCHNFLKGREVHFLALIEALVWLYPLLLPSTSITSPPLLVFMTTVIYAKIGVRVNCEQTALNTSFALVWQLAKRYQL